MRRCVLTICLSLLPFAVGYATVTNFIATADTSLIASSPDNNAGSNDFLAAGNGGGSPRRALIQFDLTTLSPGTVINAATLTLTVPSGNTNNPSSFNLFRLLDSWGEGDKLGSNGSPADAGEATWNSRFHGTAAWNTLGGDYVGDASATTFVSGFGAYTWSSAQLLTDVQLWAANPATNFGWIVISDAEAINQSARRIGSREDPLNAPVLTVEYTIIPEPSPAVLSVIGALVLFSATSIRVRWRTAPDRRGCADRASQERGRGVSRLFSR
jgi:hypothetical protein